MYKQCNVSFEEVPSVVLGVSTPLTREDRETNRMLQAMKEKYRGAGGQDDGGATTVGFGLMESQGDYIYDDADETFRY